MCDKNDTHLILLLELLHQLQNLCLDRYIQSCCRLISDQKFWMTNKSHRDHYSLSHTS